MCRSSAWPNPAGTSISFARGPRTAWRSTAASIGAAFDKLIGLLRYVDGDYQDPATFSAIKREMGSCERPAHYLAIPPVLFGVVVEQLGKSGCGEGRARHRREAVRRRPGLGAGSECDSARHLRRRRPFSASIIISASGRCTSMLYSAFREFIPGAVSGIATHVERRSDHHGRGFRSPGPRRVLRSDRRHPRRGAESSLSGHDQPDDGAAGQNRQRIHPGRKGQGAEGDCADSRRTTSSAGNFAATSRRKAWRAIRRRRRSRLCASKINSWRWQGVPFYIRAGKCLPVTCTELLIRLRRPPHLFASQPSAPNHFRFRISPDVTIALGMMVKSPDEEMSARFMELLARHGHDAG